MRKSAYMLIPWLFIVIGLEIGCMVYERIIGSSDIISRDHEIPKEKDQNEIRVVVAGGSTVQGVPVFEMGFASQLQYYLERKFPQKKINIINKGYTGQTSSDVVKTVASVVIAKADYVIVLSGHNEFLRIVSDEERDFIFHIQNNLNYFAMARVFSNVLRNFRKKPQLTSQHVDSMRRGSSFFEERMEIYRNNIATMSMLAKENGTPLILLTAPSNVLDWPPRKIEDDHLQQIFIKMKDELNKSEGTRRLAIFDKYQNQLGQEMRYLYLKGMEHFMRKEFQKAQSLLLRAKDFDSVPFRALSIHNDIVRDVAASDGNTSLIDVEKIFEKLSPGGIVGFKLIADNCHPTPYANYVIAKEITANLKFSSNIVLSENDFKQFRSHIGYREDGGAPRLKFLIENGKYGMRYPFDHYLICRKYLVEALKISPQNWEALVNLGTLYLFEKNVDRAVKYFRKAYQMERKIFEIIKDDPTTAPFINRGLESVGLQYGEFVEKVKA